MNIDAQSRGVTSLVRRVWRGRWGYAFIAPAVGLLALVHLYPILYVVYMSFTHYDVQANASRWAGMANYRHLVGDDLFWLSLRNTFVYTLVTVPLLMGIALVLAQLIFPLGPRSQNFFKAAFYLPGVVSAVVLAVVWAWLYNPDFGLLNYLLGQIGIEPMLWLGDRRLALYAVAAVAVLSGLGMPLLLFLAAMSQIPRDLYEAAEIDGAGPVRRFASVTLPLLRPSILYLSIILTIGSFQVFETIYLMTNGGPSYATMTLVFLVYESAFRYFDFGLASAQAVVLFGLVAVLALAQYRSLKTE